MDYKRLGDTLTTADYNAYVSLLKYNTSLSENFTIDNPTIKGIYADYEFNFENATIVDNGLLVTNETKSATNSVKLKNPIFKNSNYNLKFKVMSITDYNMLNEGTDNITYTDFEIILKNSNNTVNLDLSSYDNGLVILFDVEVNIKHNVEFKEVT